MIKEIVVKGGTFKLNQLAKETDETVCKLSFEFNEMLSINDKCCVALEKELGKFLETLCLQMMTEVCLNRLKNTKENEEE